MTLKPLRPVPEIDAIGDEQAKHNTYPDPIKPYNGMLLEDFESPTNWFNFPRETYAALPLLFLPERSFQYVERRSSGNAGECQNVWFENLAGAHPPPTIYSGDWVGLILSKTAEQHLNVNHGYWVNQALKDTRYWEFQLMVRNTGRGFNWYFAFNGDFTNISGYRIRVRQTNYIQLHRYDNNVPTLLDTIPIISGDMTWDWKLLRITEKNGLINVYHEELGHILQANDSTYRNMPAWGLQTSAEASQMTLGWVDNIIVR